MGEILADYEILGELGEGGMGVLYRARDTRLQRVVALKRLKPEAGGDPDHRRRFLQEARSASSLNHPHIVTIYEVGRDPDSDADFIAMELVEGESLHARLARGPLAVDEALRLATEIASGLAAAHAAGIVHRDIKPSNVMITPDGHAKILDFGLAQLTAPLADSEASSAQTLSEGPRTGTGAILGTPAYMSPEQAHGRGVDARTDVFAFGLLLYEMLTGQRAMKGETTAAVISAVLRDDPMPVRRLRPEVDREVETIVYRCLAKDPEARYPNAAPLLRDIEGCRERRAERRVSPLTLLHRPAVAVPLAVLLAALVAFVVLTTRRISRERWARQEALPELTRLADEGEFVAAFRLAQQIRPELPEDPLAEKLWNDVSLPVRLTTDPEGAEVAFKPYAEPDEAWEPLGISPLEGTRVPVGSLRWRLVKEGYEPREVTFFSLDLETFSLVPEGESPEGMIPVPGGHYVYRATRTVELPDYWLDRSEVTNRDFQRFVDGGGYDRPEYWTEPFVKEGRTLSFEEAMAGLRDTTGRPGPSTWELGSYPEGQPDVPVGGVSWYEAAAYAEFAGRSLPTFHHWFRASGARSIFSDILGFSNFGGEGPSPVGSHEGISPWGHSDMAGNVREWVWNASGTRRHTLGGAWNDPTYLFTGPDALDPFDRSPTLGFRCALYPTPPPDDAFTPIETVFRDYSKETPVDDEIFEVYRRLHSYDRGPLEARVESVDDSDERWRVENVSYAAAYGGERIPARLLLPRGVSPPYQAVLYFPSGAALGLRSSEERFGESGHYGFLVRGGRAVLAPVFKETYERRSPPGPPGESFWRDVVIQWSKDVARSLDYLEERPDIDRDRLAFHGLSMGADVGPLAAAVDARFRAVVLVAGGLSTEEEPPEVDAFHFAPRVTAPVLMINGRHDFASPLEASQKPLFRALGTPDDLKRHYIFEGGHVPPRWQEVARETLDWLDRQLGPVS